MVLDNLFSFGVFGVAALAVLWKYSSLPEIEWNWILSGAMFLLSGGFLGVFQSSLGTWVNAAALSNLVALLNLIGAILIVIGALKNAVDYLQK